MFEVKKKGNRSAVAGVTLIAIPFFLIWLYLFLFGPESGEICVSSSAFLILSIFLGLIAFGLSVPTRLRISDESIMFLRGSSIDSEVMLDNIEKVEVLNPGGNMKIEIYANGERKMLLDDVDIGADKLQAVLEELKKLSEKHHFPVIEKDSRLERMEEESLERKEMTIDDMDAASEDLSNASDEALPYRVK